MSDVTTRAYVHGSRELAYEIGEKLGLTGKALNFFSFALYEFELTLSVDTETGEATVIEIDGRKVER